MYKMKIINMKKLLIKGYLKDKSNGIIIKKSIKSIISISNKIMRYKV